MWWLAKTVQAMCIVALLYALYLGVVKDDLRAELNLLILGGISFLLARQIEKQAAG